MKKKNKFNYLIIVFACGLLLGFSLIGFGIYKDFNARNIYEEKVSSVNDLENSIDEINEQLNLLKNDLNNEFDNNGFSDEFYDINNKIELLKSKRDEYKAELEKIESGFYDNKTKKENSIVFYLLGCFILIVSFISLILKKKKKVKKGRKKTKKVSKKVKKED